MKYVITGARFVPLEGDAHFPWIGDWQSIIRPMLDFLVGRSLENTRTAGDSRQSAR